MFRFLLMGLLMFALGADGSASTNAAAPRTVLILGDSLAAAYGVNPSEGFPALLQQRIDQEKLNAKIINAGVSGDTTAGGLRRLDWLLKRPVDVLLLELGGNDGLRGIPPAVTRTNLQQIVERTRKSYPAVKVVIAGMQMPPNMGEAYTREFQMVFADVAKKNDAVLIPFLLQGVGGSIELNLPDRIHPTAKGHQVVAETVWTYLQPVLAEFTPKR